jgi:hypothetical protein
MWQNLTMQNLTIESDQSDPIWRPRMGYLRVDTLSKVSDGTCVDDSGRPVRGLCGACV